MNFTTKDARGHELHVGDRVSFDDRPDEVGTVMELLDDNDYVSVQWDGSNGVEHIDYYHAYKVW